VATIPTYQISADNIRRTTQELTIIFVSAHENGRSHALVGNVMTLIALPWFVLETTSSVGRMGFVAVAVTLPQVLVGFFAGALVDRLGDSRASVLADLTAGAGVALVPLLHHAHRLSFGPLVALVFLGNLLNTPGNTARQALPPDLIDRAAAPRDRANGWYEAIVNAATLAGLLLAGLAIPLVGTGNVLLLDAASFATSALAVGYCIPAGRAGAAAARAPYLRQLREGVRFIRQDRLLAGMIGTAAVVGLVGPVFFTVILPLFARGGLRVAARPRPPARGPGRRGARRHGALRPPRRPAAAPRRLRARLRGRQRPLALLLAAPPLAVAAAALPLSAAALAPVQPLCLTIQQERNARGAQEPRLRDQQRR